MKNRRTFLLGLTCAAVALGIVVLPTLADELFGRITKVDVSGKKLTVVSKKAEGKETEVTVTGDTVYETSGGEERKLDLEKLQGRVEKSERGVFAVITHEGGVASKIRTPEKGAFPKKGDVRKKGEDRKDGDDGDRPQGERRKGGDREKEGARP
ncbi:MAG TPA: hypothetical protein VF590_18370 [Isosphaeraceae bacterium]|jgi:hypothetical protein